MGALLTQHTNGFLRVGHPSACPGTTAPTTNTAAPWLYTGHTQRCCLVPRSAITCTTQSNRVRPQFICSSPSIHETQRQQVWQALRGNAELTPAQNQSVRCFLQFWLCTHMSSSWLNHCLCFSIFFAASLGENYKSVCGLSQLTDLLTITKADINGLLFQLPLILPF